MAEEMVTAVGRVAKELVSKGVTVAGVLDNCVELIQRGDKEGVDNLMRATFDGPQLSLLAVVLVSDSAEIAERGEGAGLSPEETDVLLEWKGRLSSISGPVTRLALDSRDIRPITSTVRRFRFDLPDTEPTVQIVEYCFDEEASRRSDSAAGILADAVSFVDAVTDALEQLKASKMELDATSVERIRDTLTNLVEHSKRICQAVGIPEDDLLGP